ncbi:Root meristem growth factor 9 [Quillaja saponaria]|uniref:Root meristem growth factor 9 n=1 Tax=Quillaja saponaria TaxID=32244 RepID=A0AAD7PJE0_QUISA|nr:Root meristem growth factor 9 [Quillaja saponaria]
MAILQVQHKRIILIVAFFVLCLISIKSTARPLQERNNLKAQEKGQEETFSTKENGVPLPDGDDLAMDYTPARKKPPIHN